MAAIADFIRQLLAPKSNQGSGSRPRRPSGPIECIVASISREVDILREHVTIPGRFVISRVVATPMNEESRVAVELFRKHRKPDAITREVVARLRKLNKGVVPSPDFAVILDNYTDTVFEAYDTDSLGFSGDNQWDMPYDIQMEWLPDSEMPEEEQTKPVIGAANLKAVRQIAAPLRMMVEDGSAPRTVEIRRLPFSIGRGLDVDLKLSAGLLSRNHLSIERDTSGSLILRDHSTNGTFLEDGTDLSNSAYPLSGKGRVVLDLCLGKEERTVFEVNKASIDRTKYPRLVIEQKDVEENTPRCASLKSGLENDTPKARVA